MRIIKIPKGHGRFRTVYAPDPPLKKYLRVLGDRVSEAVTNHVPPEVLHGFVRGCSPVSNARMHCGFAWTVTMDLRDFFDSVTKAHVEGKLSEEIIASVFYNGAPRQGLPSSPAVANLAATEMDMEIILWLQGADPKAVYTRYADDLTVSTNIEAVAKAVPAEVTMIAERHHFQVAPEKTHTYAAKAGRRIVTGVAVDDAIHPTRRTKRRLRAALHQGHRRKAEGLAEWCKLKPPRERRRRKARSTQWLEIQRRVIKALAQQSK